MTFISHSQFESGTLAGEATPEHSRLAARLPRANTFLGAELYWPGASRRCQVRDLSEGGSLLVVEAPPAVGTRVLLVRGSHRLGAQIVWSDAKRCGLRFDQPVIVADLISGKGAAPPATPAVEASHSVPAQLVMDLCSKADRLAAAIGQAAGVDPSIQAECTALAHALHRISATPATA